MQTCPDAEYTAVMRFLVISQQYLERVSRKINRNNLLWQRLRNANTQIFVVHVMTKQPIHIGLVHVILLHWRFEMWPVSQIVVNERLHYMRINTTHRKFSAVLLHVLEKTENIPDVLSLHLDNLTYLNPLFSHLLFYPFNYCLQVVFPELPRSVDVLTEFIELLYLLSNKYQPSTEAAGREVQIRQTPLLISTTSGFHWYLVLPDTFAMAMHQKKLKFNESFLVLMDDRLFDVIRPWAHKWIKVIP